MHRIGRTARGDNTGVALTFINGDDCYNFSKIEKLIEKDVRKLALPEGFEAGPEYKVEQKKHSRGKKKHYQRKRNFKK